MTSMNGGTGNILAEKLLSEHKNFESKLNGEANGNIHAIRRKAISVFEKLGFPTTKNEEWKYTDLAPFLKKDRTESVPVAEPSLDRNKVLHAITPNLEANLLVFVDGVYMPSFSSIKEEGDNFIISNFKAASGKHKELIEKHFARHAAFEKSGTVALNTAYANDGAFIYLKQNARPQYPVHLLFVSGSSEETIGQIRNLVVLEEGAQLELIETYASYAENAGFTNVVNEIVVAERASLEHYKLQIENTSSVNINLTQTVQADNSLVNQRTFTLGGALVRNDLNYLMNGRHVETHMYGLYIPSGEQTFDNHTYADHAEPDCFSNEFYKGIMMDKATGIFNGKIMVRPDAQKTNAYQSNKNILLSKEATINTKPQLEIFADDVKCSHGATIGQLDENALFYLRTRGIGEATAKAMLTHAFAEEILENFANDAFREYCESLLLAKLSRA